MTHRVLKKSLLSLLFFVFATMSGFVLASGGYFYITEGSEDYEKGKKIFYEKVVCGECPYPALKLNAEEVSKIMPALDHNGMIGKHLTLNDRKALKVYLNRRFNI